jgi:hypothetical protein
VQINHLDVQIVSPTEPKQRKPAHHQ